MSSMQVLGFLAGLARRIALLLTVTLFVFVAVEALPGDGATQLLGPNASPTRVAAVRAELELDRPLADRYVRWVAGVASGDLGTTLGGADVAARIEGPVRNSALLVVAAFTGAVVIAAVGGLWAGGRPGSRADRIGARAALVAVSVPEYAVGTLLVTILALGFGLVPPVSLVPAGGTPLDRPVILVLPALTLAVVAGSYGFRLVRALAADASIRPNVVAARLGGLPERVVLVRHLLPTVAGPLAQVLALLVPFLIGGSVVTERVTGYPGVGSLLVESLNARDVRVVEALVVVIGAVVVAAFTLADAIGAITARRSGQAGP